MQGGVYDGWEGRVIDPPPTTLLLPYPMEMKDWLDRAWTDQESNVSFSLKPGWELSVAGVERVAVYVPQ